MVINRMGVKSYSIDHLVKLQDTGSRFYRKGLFPSQRLYPYLSIVREDDNVFFTASIIFILKHYRSQLTSFSRQRIDRIVENGKATFDDYKNKYGEKTFNFWRTNPSSHFPNGKILRRFKYFSLPDDTDVTAMIYLASDTDSDEVIRLREKLIPYTNGYRKQIKNTPERYKKLRCYTTWMGVKMYHEFDFCVLCNLMYLFCKHQLRFNRHDYDTFSFLETAILTEDFKKKPFRISSSYRRPIIMLYHLSRLLSDFDQTPISHLKPLAVTELQHLQLSDGLHFMDRLMIAISLLKLGEDALPIIFPDNPESEFEDFYFFSAGMLNSFENKLAQALAPSDLFHFKYRCAAFCWSLILEYACAIKGIE